MYINGFELFETIKPGTVFRISSAAVYTDDNTIACCGPDLPPSACAGYPECSSNSTWQLLWSGAAGSTSPGSAVMDPPVCPHRYKSQ
eukprot:5523995-Prymnesium_polylepis.2